MISDASLAVMRKIARRARLPAPPPGMSAPRAWRQVLPVSAEETAGLVVTVRSVEDAVLPIADVLADWGEGDLHMLLRAPDGKCGLATVEASILSAMTECLMRGLVLAAPGAARAPTDIDAALIGPILNRWITDHQRLLEDSALPTPFAGFRAAERIEDARAATLALDEGDYHISRIGLDVDGGRRTGAIALHFPVTAPAAGTAAAGQAAGAALMPLLGDRAAPLRAILLRRRMTLAELRALAPGTLVEMPRDQLSQVRVEGLDGTPVALARLGQSRGYRALRILPGARDAGTDDAFDDARPPPGGSVDSLLSATPIGGNFDDPDAGGPELGALPVAFDIGAEDTLAPLDGLPDLAAPDPSET